MSSETAINLGIASRWSPFKQLNQIVCNAVNDKSQRILPQLESSLRKYKTDFLSLLKNPSRNALHKETVINAAKDGIVVIQQQNRVKTVIPQAMIDEALVMSDMFDLNELSSLELIIAGENQESRYPEMSRGPIAVLLYYDGRKSVLNAVHTLVQARTGRNWSLKLSRDINRVITKFTDELKDEGIVLRCIEQLSSLDIISEFDLLQRNRALGSAKYRKQVMDTLKEIRQLLANIIYCYSAQCDLNHNEVMKLIELMSKKAQLNSNGYIDSVTTTLLVSLFYALDVSVLQFCDENDARILNTPLIKHNMINEFDKQLNDCQFNVKDIKLMLQFCLAISVRTLMIYPVNGIDVDIEDEKLLDFTIENKVFDSFYNHIGVNKYISTEEFFMRKIHNLIADFIIMCPIKLKELKDKGDEVGRIINAYTAEGIQPPVTLPRYFEKFLYFMSEFYSQDGVHLSNEYWPSVVEDKNLISRHQSLHKFIRSIQDSFFPPILHIPVIKLLKSLAVNNPFNVFNLIKSSSLNLGSQFSLDYFNTALNKYYASVRGSDNKDKVSASTGASNIGLSNIQFHGQHRDLSGIETDTLCAIIELIETIVKNDRTCCLAIAENQQYSIITTMVGILRSAVPKELKASILNCLSGFATSSSSVAYIIWSKIDGILPKFLPSMNSSVINVSMSQHRMWQNGIGIEIEEIEAKNEEYSITLGFLRLMRSLFVHSDANQPQQHQSSSYMCLNFIINSILLKVNSRTFKKEEEKWLINRICFDILYTVIENYEPVKDGANSRAAFNVFSQILQENNLFRHIIFTLEDVADSIESHLLNASLQSQENFANLMELCALSALKVLYSISEKQNEFIEMVREIQGFPLAIIIKLDFLFNNVNPRTGSIDRLSTLIRLITLQTTASTETLKLLNSLCRINPEVPQMCIMQLQSLKSKLLTTDFIINAFVECLETDIKELRLQTLQLIYTCLDNIYSNSVYNLAHKLLGIDKGKTILRDETQFGQKFTCFHSILSYFESSIDVKDFLEERRYGMQIIYKLCSSVFTYETVLRFLRTSYDFIMQYLYLWEKRSHDFMSNDLEESILPEMTYFLQILTIDIKITAQQNLKTHCSSYVNFLYSETKKRRILDFLNASIFEHMHPSMPNLDFFEQKELWKTMAECSSGSESLIDVKSLHQRLLNEIRLVGPQLGLVQTNLVRTELKTILAFAASLNKSQELLATKNSYFEAWRELVEVLISIRMLGLGFFDEESNARYLLEINHELINRVCDSSTSASFLNSISSAVLIICSSLYDLKSNVAISSMAACAKSVMSALESSNSIWSQQNRTRINFYGSLLYLFRVLPQSLFNEVKFSSRLLERLCKDILSGHEVAKVLAISLLNESDLSWLNDLLSNGTLKQLMDSLLTDDREITANKCEFTKAFYVFESKMMLFMKIFSSPNGIYLLNHLDILGVLESFQSFDMYPYLIGQNIVCHKIFVNILRLILVISTTTNQHIINELGRFISSRSILCDILRITPIIKNTVEGKEVIVLISRVVSRLITYASKNLQRSFIGLLSYFYADFNSSDESEIITNVLNGCIHLSRYNGLVPLFEPSLVAQDSINHQTLGQLISIINTCASKPSDITHHVLIIESALYLIWHHLNLYFALLTIPNDKIQDVENMRVQSEYIMNDTFFSKIQTITQKNTFVDALIRRLKRIINLKKNLNEENRRIFS